MNDFELFWELFDPDEQFFNRKAATRRLWEGRTADIQKAMIDSLRTNGVPKGRNPYFFILDFRIRRPQIMSFNDYYTKFGTTEDRDGWHIVKPQKPGDPPVHYVKIG